MRERPVVFYFSSKKLNLNYGNYLGANLGLGVVKALTARVWLYPRAQGSPIEKHTLSSNFELSRAPSIRPGDVSMSRRPCLSLAHCPSLLSETCSMVDYRDKLVYCLFLFSFPLLLLQPYCHIAMKHNLVASLGSMNGSAPC